MAIRKQSSSRASTIAGRWLREMSDLEANGINTALYTVSGRELKTLCASVLSQDETKGQKRAPRKRKTS
jgi:hypothetical protein